MPLQVTVNENDPQVQAALGAYKAMVKDGKWAFQQTPDPQYDAYSKASSDIKDKVAILIRREEDAAKGMGGRRRKTRKSRRRQRKTRRYRK
jgi:hypothetical protein